MNKLVDADIEKIEGYSDIENLITKYGSTRYTYIWSSSFEHFWDSSGDLKYKFIIKMARFPDGNSEETIKIIMNDCCPVFASPVFASPGYQIMGLAIRDRVSDQWVGSRYCVYDYEVSTFEVYCSSIRFSKGRQHVEFEE